MWNRVWPISRVIFICWHQFPKILWKLPYQEHVILWAITLGLLNNVSLFCPLSYLFPTSRVLSHIKEHIDWASYFGIPYIKIKTCFTADVVMHNSLTLEINIFSGNKVNVISMRKLFIRVTVSIRYSKTSRTLFNFDAFWFFPAFWVNWIGHE